MDTAEAGETLVRLHICIKKQPGGGRLGLLVFCPLLSLDKCGGTLSSWSPLGALWNRGNKPQFELCGLI